MSTATAHDVVMTKLDEWLGVACPDWWPDTDGWARAVLAALASAGYVVSSPVPETPKAAPSSGGEDEAADCGVKG